LKPKCVKKNKSNGNREYQKIYRSLSPNYKFNKNEGLPHPKPKKKRNLSAMTVEKWNALSSAERWELMDLTEISREIAAMYPRKSFGHVRLLKEQGRLHEDFGKRRVEIDG
jgi:hypothetical protein